MRFESLHLGLNAFSKIAFFSSVFDHFSVDAFPFPNEIAIVWKGALQFLFYFLLKGRSMKSWH